MVKNFCFVSDRNLASEMNQGRFELEGCGFMQNCAQEVEQCDFNISPDCLVVMHCETDWMKAGPFLLCILVVLYFLYKKLTGAFSRRREEMVGKTKLLRYR